MMGFGFGFMGIFWLVAIAVVVVLAVLLARGAFRGSEPGSSGSAPAEGRPEDILRRRFARGEIDREEYRRRLEDLRA